MQKTRLEKDSLGAVFLPKDAYYGSHTQRSLNNFPISQLLPHPEYIYSTVFIKKAAAKVNNQLSLLNDKRAKAIIFACDEILSGKFISQFVVSPYQSGAGTSHNMNVNEVIANRANQILGANLGNYKFIHPNDHVNMSQSTNDVIPASIRIASLLAIPQLFKNLKSLINTFSQKARQFSALIKSGRTHLRDALPLTLGQEFGAYAQALVNDLERINYSSQRLKSLGIGGTAVGTGINTHKDYHLMMVRELSKLTKLTLTSSGNLFESMQNTADFLDLSVNLKILAQNLVRIGQDLRLLSSGPKTGLAEITLPSVIPGSSIMPGKINPSIIEMLIMVCFQVIAMEQAITLSSLSGQLELNVFLPLIAYDLLEQQKLLTQSISIFNDKCVSQITADKKMCQFWFAKGYGIAALLNPYLGYDKTAELVQLSLKFNKNIKELAVEKGYLSDQKIAAIFSLKNLTRPNVK